MRKFLLLSLILLVPMSWAVAQQQYPSQPGAPSSGTQATPPSPSGQAPGQTTQPSPSAQSPMAAGGSSVEGCLGGSAGNFTISDKSGTTYRLELPQGADATVLNKHIGEEIRVTGTVAGAADTTAASSAGAKPTAGAAGGGGQPSIAVSRIDKVADTCGNRAAPSKPNP